MGSAARRAELDASTGESPSVALAFTRPFLLSKREITVGQLSSFVVATRCGHPRPAAGSGSEARGYWQRDRSWQDPDSRSRRVTRPVVASTGTMHVLSPAMAVGGKRQALPAAVRAEWEYAARGGTSFPRFWGEQDSREDLTLSLACDYANVYDASAVPALGLPWPNARCSDRAATLVTVAQYKPNAFGIHDIIGNAREWVMDCFTASYLGRPDDLRAWTWQAVAAQVVRAALGESAARRPARTHAL